MAKFKQLILIELGNTTDAYDWQLDSVEDNGLYYSFFSENYEYEVKFLTQEYSDWFYTTFDTMSSTVPFEETDEGNQFRVMATIMKIAKDAWNRRNETEFGKNVEGFSFDAYGKKLKLYKTFINTQFPNAEILKGRSEIKVKPNKQNG